MLKSLFSGVSGLQSHQVAMDVESNNIANVNTVGFKYSRANFSDLLAQTQAIATSPQGQLGGKNPVQVGLGSTVSSMTRIFSQGSVENSDKNTDVAIQGDGFFVVSPDGGTTYKYTRAGDFKFDAGGNFVDNNGFITQGWLRDPVTGKVDSTAPISNINIPPGLTTPANATEEVVLKANLNSGAKVESFSTTYEVPSIKDPITGFPVPPTNTPALDASGNPIASSDVGVMFNESGEGFSLQQGQGIWASFESATVIGDPVLGDTANLDIALELDNGTSVSIAAAGIAGNSPAQNAAIFVNAINAQSTVTGVAASFNGTSIEIRNDNNSSTASRNIRLTSNAPGSGLATEEVVTAFKYTYDSTGSNPIAGDHKTFKSISDLRYALEVQANSDANGNPLDKNVTVIVNKEGKLEISNPGGGADDTNVNIAISSVVEPGITENKRFTQGMQALGSTIPVGSLGKAFSQGFNDATHSSSIDVFDSLGSKHTLRMEFRKVDVNPALGATWDLKLSVPSPATIDTLAPTNEKTGSVRFNNDGSLATLNPPNVSFSGNNGSAPNQQINLSFGTANAFDGMTSFDSRSSTSGISQDGFTGGDLVGIRIDQSGTLVGSFSNGRSFGLGQIAMAKFTNNEGLSTEGGNVYNQTANSGDPIIGTAATAGRGFMQSSALESSNVDLSRALTQLIIIQRGYQANGKTITTSDQLLQTLIGLKQ